MSSSALISSVYRRKPLWDPLDVHHHNRTVIAKLWQEVAHELSVNVMVAKAKWRGLRDYYRQQLRRNTEVGGGYASGWAHFEEMSFLWGTMTSGRPKPAIKEEEGDDEDLASEEGESVDVAHVLEQKWSPPTSGCLVPQEAHESESDDDLHFFKSLIPDMKGLPRATKSYIRLRIQQVVHDEIYAKEAKEKNTNS